MDENVQDLLTIKNVDVAKEDGSTIARLLNIVSEGIALRNSDPYNTLPDVVYVRHNHYLLSVYCESKIAEEIMKEKAFVLPDGTSRQGIGDIAGMVMKVGDKICAFKSLKISKGDRSNWATAIIHMLDHLATASKVEIETICKSITAMVSDLCKVNKQLASEIQGMTGSEWLPGQAFCNLHFTLAIPEGIKSMLFTHQSYIGADKLFPKTVSFEMNIEDKIVIIQILDFWMRFEGKPEHGINTKASQIMLKVGDTKMLAT